MYNVAENMAVKEIVRDPIEFMRQESINYRDQQEMKESFYSVEEDGGEENDIIQKNRNLSGKLNYVLQNIEEQKESDQESEKGGRKNKHESEQLIIGDDKISQELDDVFHDALDFIPASKSVSRKESEYDEEEAKERELLPYFKDPKVKISVWTIIKDSIGKDIAKMSVPVYFNEPTGFLQKCC